MSLFDKLNGQPQMNMQQLQQDPIGMAQKAGYNIPQNLAGNPQAMVQAVAAAQAVELVGLPEARLSLTQAIIFICESPKSNSVVTAMSAAFADTETAGVFEPVPVHLRDTHYGGYDRIGAGNGYLYPHDYPAHWVQQQYLPTELSGKRYYEPSDQGQEAKIRENHQKRDALRNSKEST